MIRENWTDREQVMLYNLYFSVFDKYILYSKINDSQIKSPKQTSETGIQQYYMLTNIRHTAISLPYYKDNYFKYTVICGKKIKTG